MKKIIVLSMFMATLFMVLSSCAVNSSTGSITVINTTGTDASNVKVGDVYIGFVGKGQTSTVYFTSAKDDSQLVCDGFSFGKKQVGSYPNYTYEDYKGTINLKLNFQYSMMLYNLTSTSTSNPSGKYAGISGTKLDWDRDYDKIKTQSEMDEVMQNMK